MAREELNKWGEPVEPALYVDEWFPSEKPHQSEGMEVFSRAYVPVGIVIGLLLLFASIAILTATFASGKPLPVAVLGGVFFGAWAITFLVPYGTLVYYAIKKQVLISRRDRGLPIDMEPEDIDGYSVPLRAVPGFGLTMSQLDAGMKAVPTGMRRARLVTVVAVALFVVAGLLGWIAAGFWPE